MATLDRIANINSFTREFGFETRRLEITRSDNVEAMSEVEADGLILGIGCLNLNALSPEDRCGWGHRIVNYAVPQSIDQLTDKEIAEIFRDIIVSKQSVLVLNLQGQLLDESLYSADRIEIKVDADGEMSPGMLFFISGHADPEERQEISPQIPAHGLDRAHFLNRSIDL